MSRVPLKHLVDVNELVLGEDTDPGRLIRYIDIGSVGTGVLVYEPKVVSFREAPSRARRLVREGDTIVSTVRTYLRAVWPVRQTADDLVVSTGFAVLTPRPELDPRYLGWLAQSTPFVDAIVARSVGVSYPAVAPGEIGELRIDLPPLPEQRSIADYLDTETARIDALIAKKQRVRAAIAERRVSLSWWLLSGPDIPGRRRSGPTEWLPSVPEAWDVVAATRLFDVQLGRMLNQDRAVGEHLSPYMRNANVGWGRIDINDVAEMDFPPSERRRYRIRPGDLLVCEGGAGVAEAAVWQGELADCFYQKSLHRIRARTGLPVEWLAEWLRIWKSVGAHEAEGNLATIPHLTAEQLRAHQIPVPPASEACARLKELRRQAAQGERIAERLAVQIGLLREHRQALITAAVTGELEISGVA